MITKLQAGYAHFASGSYDCDDCPFWIDPGNLCVLHGPKDEFLPHDSCNYNLLGVPNSFGTVPLGLIQKNESGFVRSDEGFSCKRCKHFSRNEAACNLVDAHTPGADPGIISPNGCCNAWEASSIYASKSNEFFEKAVFAKSHNLPSDAARAVTSPIEEELSRGIADVTVSPDGKRDIDKLGRSLAAVDHVDVIYTSPLFRCIQTARAIQRYSPGSEIRVLDGLMTWSYGGEEAQPASETKDYLLNYAKKKAASRVPGKGPISGAPGDPFDDWKERIITKGFLPIMRVIERYQNLVIAIITHSRDIYTLEGWLELGMPRSLAISFKPMSGEKHGTAEVAKLTKSDGGAWDTSWLDLEKPDANLGRHKPEGLLIRHGGTSYNSSG